MAGVDFSIEYPVIRAMCANRGLDVLFICAIRVAEGGGPGRQFGVVSVDAPDYDTQLRVCTRTIAGYLADYDCNPFALVEAGGMHRLVYTPAFISYCQIRYAPTDAANDPNSLNANWRGNVQRFYDTFVQHGYPLWPI